MMDGFLKLKDSLIIFVNGHLLPFIKEHPQIVYVATSLVALRIAIWIVTLFCFRRQRSGWPRWPRVLTSRFSPSILIQITGILTPYRLAMAMIPLRLTKMMGTLSICVLMISFYPEERWLHAFNGYRWPLFGFGVGVAVLASDKLFLISIARVLIPGRIDILIKPKQIIILKHLFGIPIPQFHRWDPSRHTIKSHTMPHSRSTDPEENVFRDGHIVILVIGAATVELTTIIGRQYAEQIAYLFSSPIRDLLQIKQAGVDRSKIITTALDYGTQIPKAE